MVPVLLTLVLYTVLATACLGWGVMTVRALGIGRAASESALDATWIGWASAVLVYQALHLFVPLSVGVVLAVLIPGLLVGAFEMPRTLRRAWVSQPGGGSAAALAGVTLLTVAAWLAARAMLAPSSFDSGLYHFQSIRWINEHPIVPGLANLHLRLGFNQSFFVFAASQNYFPLFNHGRAVANSFLVLLLCAQTIGCLASASLLRPAHGHRLRTCAHLLMAPALVYVCLVSNGLASPSPDLASTVLHLVLFLKLVQTLGEMDEGAAPDDARCVFLMLMAATAVTVKLSNAAIAATIVVAVLVWLHAAAAFTARRLIRVLGAPFLVVAVWMLRGVITSGNPVYPLPWLQLPVEWALPVADAHDLSNWIYSWARRPFAHWETVIGNWDWFPSWFGRTVSNTPEVSFPFVAGLLLLASRAVLTLARVQRPVVPSSRASEFTILAAMIVPLALWFVTAPDPRFANALFWCWAVGAAILLLAQLHGRVTATVFRRAALVAFVVVNADLGYHIARKSEEFANVSRTGWQPVPVTEVTPKRTTSGLVVLVGAKQGLCWDAPLPCAWRFHPGLRLRGDSLASGFVLDSSHVEYQKSRQERVPDGGTAAEVEPAAPVSGDFPSPSPAMLRSPP